MTVYGAPMLSLVIPVFNEEHAVADVLKRADAVLQEEDEIIVVDDGSTDGTHAAIASLAIPRIRIIRHERNLGNGAAIATGIKASHGEWIATIDADRTYWPEDITRLYQRVREENADMIVGVREGLKHGVWHHRIARDLLRRWGEIFARQKIADINSGLRIANRELFERYLHLYPHRFSLHIALMIAAARDGAKILYEPISYGPRTGTSKLSLGLRGPWNFAKFLLLIPSVAARSHKSERAL